MRRVPDPLEARAFSEVSFKPYCEGGGGGSMVGGTAYPWAGTYC